MKVIDVSEHQGVIDWEKVKTQIDGAILRVGYGNDEVLQDDKYFIRNANECTRLGIPFGVYIYSYATNEFMVKSEANHVLRLVKNYKLAFPIYLDVEESGCEWYARAACEIFGNIIEENGYWCGVYANKYWWQNYLNGLERFTKWVAQYNSFCDYVKNYDMWQYTSSAHINGIDGNVDMNECYKNFPQELGRVNTPSGMNYKIGDKVRFSTCYVSSSDPNSKAIPERLMLRNYGTITYIKVGAKNPYLLDDGLCWVNDGDIREKL